MASIRLLLLRVNVSMTAFIIFTVYSIIVGFSIASSIAAFAFASLYGFNMFLKHKEKEVISEEMMNKIKHLESNLQAVKMAQGMRTLTGEDKRKIF